MISKIFRIVRMIVLASFALSSAAWATCSNASLSGTYGFLGGGTDTSGNPITVVGQFTANPTTATFTGTETVSDNGLVIPGVAITGKYAVASNCTGTGAVAADGSKAHSFYFVVTSAGVREVFGETGTTQGVILVAEGSPTCTNAGLKGGFGFQTTGIFLAGAPVTGPVAFVGALSFSVNSSGDGVLSGRVAGSEDGTIFTFTEAPVTGSYSVNSDCTGTATITPEGQSALNFNFVVVDGGKEMLAIETDADTVVSGTLQH
jgi:hypothetical protein